MSDDTPWLTIARAELGIREGRDDARIVEYLSSTRLPERLTSTSATPWCAAFAGWCLSQAGMRYTLSAAARSYAHYGSELSLPRRGCVAVYERGVAMGHVGFWLREDAKYDYLIGGNQGNRVRVKAYPKDRLIAYRWPVKALTID